jgi:hypothetical protein
MNFSRRNILIAGVSGALVAISPAAAAIIAGSPGTGAHRPGQQDLNLDDLDRTQSGDVRSSEVSPRRQANPLGTGMRSNPHLLLTGRTAAEFSLVSSTSSVSWWITRRSPSRSVYCTLSRLISTSSS